MLQLQYTIKLKVLVYYIYTHFWSIAHHIITFFPLQPSNIKMVHRFLCILYLCAIVHRVILSLVNIIVHATSMIDTKMISQQHFVAIILIAILVSSLQKYQNQMNYATNVKQSFQGDVRFLFQNIYTFIKNIIVVKPNGMVIWK